MQENKIEKISRYCEEINRECFWEYNFSNSEILKMAQNGSEQEKMFLFSKIMDNATDVLRCLDIFTPVDQQKMALRYKAPLFNHSFLDKRHKIIKYFITKQQVDIPELRWNV